MTRPAAGRRRGLLIASAVSTVIAGTDLAILTGVAPRALRLVGPVLLLGAGLCLLAVWRRALQDRRHASVHSDSTRRQAQAVDGPCDGQQLALRAGLPLPAEVWLGVPEARDQQLHRYVLDRPSWRALRYSPP